MSPESQKQVKQQDAPLTRFITRKEKRHFSGKEEEEEVEEECVGVALL